MRKLASVIVLVTAACGGGGGDGGGGGGGGIAFEGERTFLESLNQDSGLIPAGSPVQVRLVAAGGGSIRVRARANVRGSMLEPVPGSGELTTSGRLMLALHGKIEQGSIHWEGPIQTVEYVIPDATTAFEPFLVGSGDARVTSMLPPAELGTFPVPSVPGATVTLRVTGGSLLTVFRGSCATVAMGHAQYTGEATTSGTIDLSATVTLSVPVVGSRDFGPFAFSVPVPDVRSPIDLGVFGADGRRVMGGPMPCSGMQGGDGGSPVDAGAPVDGGGGSDAGSPEEDAGGMTCGRVEGLEPLPASCLPRCTSTSRDAVAACADVGCILDAMAADTTPSSEIATPDGTLVLDCGVCGSWQIQTCMAEVCPAEYGAFVDCVGECVPESDALTTCLNATPGFADCVTTRLDGCFALGAP